MKIPSDDEFMKYVAAKERKRVKFIKKKGKCFGAGGSWRWCWI